MLKFGRYELIREIGRGGMAVVYLANDPRFNRQVAIKVLPSQLTFDPRFRARFEKEARIIASLEHTSIVPVHDYGEENGQPYLVMRFMPNGSLRDRIEKRKLSLEEALTVLRQIAPGLDKAHKQGIVHRDLKPENILFGRDNEPAISDFGIAKIAESATLLTGTGILGTPAYMSPEQVTGEKLDGRSDQYSLAVVLFEMLTGRVMFKGSTPAALVIAHIKESPPSISRDRKDLPLSLDAILKKALSKKPANRFKTLAAFVAKLNAVEPTNPGPSTRRLPHGETPIDAAPATRLILSKQTTPSSGINLWAKTLIAFGVVALIFLFFITFSPDQSGNTEPTPFPSVQVSNANLEQTKTPRVAETVVVQALAQITVQNASQLVLLSVFEGHQGDISVLEWAPDGSLLASGSLDNSVRIWDATNGGVKLEFTEHSGGIEALAWSPDGIYLGSAGNQKIYVWVADTGELNNGFEAQPYENSPNLSFSADSSKLAAVVSYIAQAGWAEVRSIKVFNVQEALLVASFPKIRNFDEVYQLAWAPSGDRLVFLELSNIISIADMDSGDLVATVYPSSNVFHLEWLEDSSQVIGFSGEETYVWDARGRLISAEDRSFPIPFPLSLSTNLDLVLTFSRKNIDEDLPRELLQLLDWNSGELLLEFDPIHELQGLLLSWSPDGTRLATAGTDNVIRIWGIPGQN